MPSIRDFLGSSLGNAAIGLGSGLLDYRNARAQGHSVASSIVRAAGPAFLWYSLNPTTALAVTFGPTLAKAAVSGLYSRYQTNAIESRRMVTPFSHSFTHTDATLRAQERGMQAIYGGRSRVGASAGMMQQLYGRR